MLKVQFISRLTIKPSSPTPHHLSNFKLSLLDQRVAHLYTPIIFFYSVDCGDDNISTVEKVRQLKDSLSDTLTQFYPLAGRFKDGYMVECKDEGVEFSEAQVHGRLSEFLNAPHVEVLNQLVPCSFLGARSGTDVILAVQINIFDCGGMAIGVCLSHKIADGVSLATFINGWASTSRGVAGRGPEFQSSKLFPTEGPMPTAAVHAKENIRTKRFVFDASKIAALRGGPPNQLGYHPTRVEAVSALIWRCVMRTHGVEEGSTRTSAAMHAVDLRRRMVPPLPEYSFGNIMALVASVAMVSECHEDMQRYLERKLRDATKIVNMSYIKELQKPEGILRARESKERIEENSDYQRSFCFFSSWCRLPFYDVDFGWGSPTWVGTCTFPMKNCTVLMATRDGNGIEAWVNMEDVDMARFEQDLQLLSFVSPPSTG